MQPTEDNHNLKYRKPTKIVYNGIKQGSKIVFKNQFLYVGIYSKKNVKLFITPVFNSEGDMFKKSIDDKEEMRNKDGPNLG